MEAGRRAQSSEKETPELTTGLVAIGAAPVPAVLDI
jgi:hypothetical protein